MTTTAPDTTTGTPHEGVAAKGLKIGAIGLISSIVIAVASTAPAYSAAATLGGIAQQVGNHAPIILLLAFLPMLFIFSVVALIKVYVGSAGEAAIKITGSWFNPFDVSFSALSAGFLLAAFIYWGWDSAVAANEETENPTVNPGRAAVISTIVLLLTY